MSILCESFCDANRKEEAVSAQHKTIHGTTGNQLKEREKSHEAKIVRKSK
jgi:hypothetical protein